MQDTKMANSVGAKSTILMTVLDDDQTVLERVHSIRGRLAEMEVRLFGESDPAEGDGGANPVAPGILGQFNCTNAATVAVLEAISQSLTNIETAV